jgi:hypothetical protein
LQIPIGPWAESEEDKGLGKFTLAISTLDIVGSILRLAIEDFGRSEKDIPLLPNAERDNFVFEK